MKHVFPATNKGIWTTLPGVRAAAAKSDGAPRYRRKVPTVCFGSMPFESFCRFRIDCGYGSYQKYVGLWLRFPHTLTLT